jgi:CheY-like chemotaxis protein
MSNRDHGPTPAFPAHEPTPTGALVRELANLKAMLDSQRRELEELREAQAQLEASRNDYAELHDLAPIALLTISRGVIRSANLAAAELFEQERGSLIHRSLRSFVHRADRPALLDFLAKKGARPGFLARLRVRSGANVTAQIWARASSRHPEVQHLSLVVRRQLEPTTRPPRRRILLVEDHADTAQVLSMLLEQQGYAVVAVHSLHDALESGPYVDAIISDIALPDGSGLDLLRQLPRGTDQPAIALSGQAMPADVTKQAGFDLHLTKPIDFSRLAEALDALLERRQRPAGLSN